MKLPETMRAVVLTGHGGVDKLEYQTDIPTPSPAAGDVLIAVSACGMNNTDINTRTGWYSKAVASATSMADAGVDGDGSWGGGLTFPRIQGADPSGAIAAVGEGVDPSRIGQTVLVDGWIRAESGHLEDARYLGSELDGGYAEFVVVPAVNAHPINTDLSPIELATFPCSYATAEHMLHRAGVRAAQWVLVSGASGGVGGALVQLAKRRNANVVAITSRAKMTAVAELGADVVLDRGTEAVDRAVMDATGGVDVFADPVGGEGFARLFETIRRGGHYTTAGAIAGPIVELDLRTLYLNDLTMHGATVLPTEVFANLVGYIDRGEIKPIVAATFPLERLAEAQTAFAAKEHIGAIVIEI